MADKQNQKISQVYDDWADWFPYIYGPIDHTMQLFSNCVENSLKKRLPSGIVIDAGCGTGLSTKALLDAGYDVIGVDLSEKSLNVASDWLVPEYGDRVKFVHADISNLPESYHGIADGLFASTSLLAHALTSTAVKKMTSSLCGLVRAGGVLAIAHYDYQRLMSVEPDIAPSQPVFTSDNSGPFIFFQQRSWSGEPRSRRYRTEYFRLGLDGTIRKLDVDYLATPLSEITEILAENGCQAIAWLEPGETGFFKPIGLVTKNPVPDSHFRANRLEHVASNMHPIGNNNVAGKFQFFPEDLDQNPFEEEPSYKESTLQVLKRPNSPDVITRRKQVSLVMFSGGVDSVYTLYRLLKESDDEIIAHHIHFINREGRHKAEDIACRQIVQHLKTMVRPFIYTESSIDRRRFQAFGMDDMAVAFEVGVIANSFLIDRGHMIDRWTTGTCLEEELEYYGQEEVERFEHILNTAAASCYPSPAPRFFQLKIIPKRDQIAYMGETLTRLCWTCRKPVWKDDGTAEECGQCKTCNLMTRIRNGEETIKSKPKQSLRDATVFETKP
ncbi:MAG: methyltransferase domain-containing protein [Alphaproteobacteria bacterium]|nr:methyltransferase domain-containing protein [Alphaproteobacteria bacterium]